MAMFSLSGLRFLFPSSLPVLPPVVASELFAWIAMVLLSYCTLNMG